MPSPVESVTAKLPAQPLLKVASFPEMNQLYAEFFPTDPPARMTMQVPLPRGLLISIGCTAVTDR